MTNTFFYIFFILSIAIVWTVFSLAFLYIWNARHKEMELILDIKKDIEIIKEEFKNLK